VTTGNTLGLEPTAIGNPHGVPAEVDRVMPVVRDVPGYSETAFLTSWNPDAGVGLFLHVGRCQQDLDMWWAQTLAYLPGGRVASDRSYGRSPDGAAVRTGNLLLEMTGEIGVWTAAFDGAAEITTPAVMATRPTGAGIARPLRFEFRTEPAGPIWDLYAALGRGSSQDWATGTHTQQVLRITGHLRVDGAEYPLDGIAGNDHSSGARSMTNFGHHHFLIGAYPGGTIQAMSIFSMTGDPLMESGSHARADGAHNPVVLVDVPPMTSLDEGSGEFTATLVEADGTKTPIRIELLHTLPLSLNNDGDNINGTEWEGPDLLVLAETRVRITLPDGTIGYAHLERSTQRSRLPAG
jgi:hypothetical protein